MRADALQHAHAFFRRAEQFHLAAGGMRKKLPTRHVAAALFLEAAAKALEQSAKALMKAAYDEELKEGL